MFEVIEVRRDSHAWNGDGTYAEVRLDDGATLFVSHLDDEPAGWWVADALFGANSYPHWSHGFGSRCTLLKTVGNPAMVAELEAKAAALTV